MMTYVLPVFYAMLQIFTFLTIGFLLRRYNWFSERFFTSLGQLIMRIALPAYFFTSMSQADLNALVPALRFPAIAVFICAAATVVGWGLFSLLRFNLQDRKAGIALSGFGNASYLPLSIVELVPLSLPVISELFHTETAIFFIGAYVFVFSPLLWSFGMVFISGGSPRHLLKGIISPPMIGIATGLAAALLGLGPILTTPGNPLSAVFPAIERIGAITIPIILIVLGSMAGNLHIHGENWRQLLKLSGAVSLVRFVVLPAIFFLIAPLLYENWGWTLTGLWVVFLEMTTPPATNLSIMAAHAGINQEHTTFTLLSTYLLYLFIFPVYLMLFLHQLQLLGGTPL
ncbi:MAG: AEC family transporter [Spirochaeta sp.]